MTLRQVKRVLDFYDDVLWAEGWKISKGSLNMENHLRWMCQEVKTWRSNRKDKAMRWLGFIQGWMVAKGRYTIKEVKLRRALVQGGW